MKRKKRLLFGFFSENMSYSASILSSLAIEKGWNVDLQFFGVFANDENIIKAISESRPDLVALTFKTLERKKAFQVARIAKAAGHKVICGGIHPSVCPNDVQSTGSFDAIVIGDGMGVFAELLDGYTHLNGDIIHGRKHSDLRLYTKRYFSQSQKERMKNSQTYEVLTSMGCPFNCYFCSTNTKFLELPIEAVAEDILAAKNNFNIEKISIVDNTFTFSLERLKTFNKFLKKNELRFAFHLNGRVDCFNDKIAEELASFGTEDANFGIETASQKLLDFINKQATVEDAYRAAEICKKHSLSFKISLMFGLPTQDKTDYETTLRFVKEVQPDSIHTYYFAPFPGTYLFKYCLENGYFPENFSLDNFFDIDETSPNFKGFRQEAGMLKNIDYAMATEYMNKIMELENKRKDAVIIKRITMADKEPWILFGSGDYFYRVLERLSAKKWKNCLGYYDIFEDKYKERTFFLSLPRYDLYKSTDRPQTAVVTTHFGHVFNTTVLALLRNKLHFNGKIISVSTQEQREGFLTSSSGKA